jgi:hypothetical protein
MSGTQDVDLLINVVGLGALLWLSAAAVVRWIHKGRIESYPVEALLPKGLPSWVRWLLAPTLVITPAPASSGSDPRRSWTITPWGWVYISGIAVWLLVKVVKMSP